MHKGLLFDLDGVIVDTAKYHYLAWKEIADELGIDFTEQDNERLKGVSRMQSFEIVLEVGGKTMSREEKEQYCEKKNEVYLTYIRKLKESEILPGIRAFLEDVKEKGYKIALGSASKNSRLILDRLHLTEIFDEIIDGTKTSKAKPDPEVFVLGAKALGFACEECIVFEDAKAGIEAAHAGGMQAVGIGSRSRLPEADFNIPGFADMEIEAIEKALN
ncbi:MAG: beta-phosphoglucomutase [Acetivibrio ethanolgignens]